MKCSAWIRTCVDVFDHPVLDNGPYDRRSAWLWLIARANWKDKRVNHKGKLIDLKRGQMLAGRAFLAEKWGWSEKAVRTYLSALSADGMIEMGQSSGHYANVLTICNYDAYQTKKEPAKPEQGPEAGQCGASAGPDSNKDTLTTVSQSVAPDELKSAFNGSTANMLADVQRWMGGGADEQNARKWLTNMLAYAGQSSTSKAYQTLIVAEGSGKVVSNPLAFWSRTANTMKANPDPEPRKPKPDAAPPSAMRALLDAKIAKEGGLPS